MAGTLVAGLIAGAAGTVALNVATYADMAYWGRPSSSTPSQMAGVLAERAGVDLGAGLAREAVENRKSGVGALLGYGNGLGVGAAYALLRPALGWLPGPARAVAVGLVAMAASDVPIARLGVSDPATWAPQDWAADLLPHLAYGIVTVAAYEALRGR